MGLVVYEHRQPLLHAAGFDVGALKEQDCPDYITRGVLEALGVQKPGSFRPSTTILSFSSQKGLALYF